MDGWTPTDLIFPFFLFIVGTSIGLGTRQATAATILRRGAIIWGLGLFVALGRNAILLFVLSGLLAKTLIYLKWPDPTLSLGGWLYVTFFLPIASPYNASLLYAIANLALLFAVLGVLHRKRLYLTV